jgi:hypothetical protein
MQIKTDGLKFTAETPRRGVFFDENSESDLLCRKLLINTRLQPGAHGVRREKNRLNGFSWARSWFTALKRGVNEMISTEQKRLSKTGTPSIARLDPT